MLPMIAWYDNQLQTEILIDIDGDQYNVLFIYVKLISIHLNIHEHDCVTLFVVNITTSNINIHVFHMYSKTCLLQTQILQNHNYYEYNGANPLVSRTSL